MTNEVDLRLSLSLSFIPQVSELFLLHQLQISSGLRSTLESEAMSMELQLKKPFGALDMVARRSKEPVDP